MNDGCPTCSHTLARLSFDGITGHSHCERCGTVVVTQRGDLGPQVRDVYVPKLVERCRAFEKCLPPGNPPDVSYSHAWQRLGIRESINRPEDRP